MSVKVYGASDDLIEVEGDVREEFSYVDDAEMILAFSDGTALGISYGSYGRWNINKLASGTCEYSHIPAPDEDEGGDNYSDVVTLTGDIKWVVYGTEFVSKKRRKKN